MFFCISLVSFSVQPDLLEVVAFECESAFQEGTVAIINSSMERALFTLAFVKTHFNIRICEGYSGKFASIFYLFINDGVPCLKLDFL